MKKPTSAQKGAWTAAAWAAALALAVLINLVVRAVAETYTQLDLSEAGLYSLSPESLQVIREDHAGSHGLLSLRDRQRGYPDPLLSEPLCSGKSADHLAAERHGTVPDFCCAVWGGKCLCRKFDPGFRRGQLGAGCSRAV